MASVKSRYIVYLIGAIMAMDFMIVLTSISGFWTQLGGSIKLYGIVFAIYDLAQFLVGPLLGWIVDRRTYKEVFLVTIVINIIGNFLYSFAYDEKSQALFVIGRVIAGIGAGNLSIGFGYMALTTEFEDRSSVFGIYRFWNTVGRMLGPFIGSFLFFIGNSKFIGLSFNEFTWPAYVIILADVILIVLTFFIDEPDRAKELTEFTEKPSEFQAFMMLGKDGITCLLFYGLSIIAFWSWFPLVLVFAVVEYGFGTSGGDYAFAYSAVGWGFGAAIILFRIFEDKKVPDYIWLCIGPVFMVAGFTMYLFGGATAMYLIATSIICFGFNIVATIYGSYFSKLVDEKNLSQFMATFLGVMFGISSLGRFIGPVWAPTVLEFGATGADCCNFNASPPVLDCCTVGNKGNIFVPVIIVCVLVLLGNAFALRRKIEKPDYYEEKVGLLRENN